MKKNTYLSSHPQRVDILKTGFTLIELLVVIVIIATLAVTVFIALNPVKRLQDARNARRTTDTESLRNAINEYLVDKGVLPQGLTAGMPETQIGTSNGSGAIGNPTCIITSGGCNVITTSCVDITAQLLPYLKTLPQDPKIGSASATGYSVSVDTNNNPTIKSCGTETAATSSMPPPSGYSNLIFDDQFSGTTLDSTKWIPQMADAQYGIWQDNGKLPNPYSAVSNDGFYNAEYGDPSEVVVNNGLTLNAQRDSTYSFYSWKAGYITTHGKFSFNHGYVQIRAKMPDSTTGGWAGFWFLDGGGEIDLNESGFTGCGSSIVNQCTASNLHTSGNSQKLYNTGVDLSAGYHTYGMEYIPGQSVTTYLDGKQIAQFTSNVPTGSYTILITETMAQNTSGWHTLTSGSTQSPLSPFNVSEVQVWQ